MVGMGFGVREIEFIVEVVVFGVNRDDFEEMEMGRGCW